ncbi:MAG TPA: ABC transporter ATP-binding protein [Egibacteraceae bacterium]|nr:ABC transporter ATP-binding protein [Egibacteraceae bacterium]
MNDAVLSVRAMATGYAGMPVLRDVTFDVAQGEVVCMLGPNGAGKTSTLLAVSGELPLLAGEVIFDGTSGRLPLHKRARRGLAYVTEERSIFKSLTTAENLRCGGVRVEQALELFPELESRISVRAGLLSGGEQQMLTLARALSRRPKLLLADELSLGLAPLIVDRLLQAVRAAADAGTGVLMVEQHAQKALKYADRVLVMRRGTLEMSISATEARARLGEIEDAYLSTSAG